MERWCRRHGYRGPLIVIPAHLCDPALVFAGDAVQLPARYSA